MLSKIRLEGKCSLLDSKCDGKEEGVLLKNRKYKRKKSLPLKIEIKCLPKCKIQHKWVWLLLLHTVQSSEYKEKIVLLWVSG